MKITRIETVPYCLKLRAPLCVGSLLLREREGVLVRMESASGAEGWGDAAPLAGYSRESIGQARSELEQFCAAPPPDVTGTPDDLFRSADGLPLLSSSARFAVESALASVAAAIAGKSLAAWLFGVDADRCPVNALISGEPEGWAERARAARAEGFTVAKFKVGRAPISQELAALRDVHAAAPELLIRLDANRAWSPLVARGVADELAGLPLDYIEEPVRAGVALPAQWPRDMGVALDESLHGEGPVPDPAAPVVAWVLKPTLVGGLVRALRLAAQARTAGRRVIFSSAYESGVGIRVLAELAAVTGQPAGLDTHAALETDVLAPRLQFSRGALELAAARGSVVQR
ncbi:MAG TPA: o-succinylbenzoate synthase [Kiritimatiellia bacterium]|nr:o-succinylbenzoate synthase [Kiritimatiellia bacterium]